MQNEDLYAQERMGRHLCSKRGTKALLNPRTLILFLLLLLLYMGVTNPILEESKKNLNIRFVE